jgi:hypothetical protein
VDCAACGRLDAGSGAVPLLGGLQIAGATAVALAALPAMTTAILHASTGGRPFGDRPLLAQP